MTDPRLVSLFRCLRGLASPDSPSGETDADLLRRFVAGRDAGAFDALVRRHGRLVFGVCRHVLGHEQDAEDAFQATFLVLARKAASVRNTTSLAGWLHGVARRVALDARRTAGRRRTHEAQAPSAPPRDPSWEAAWREVQAVLDDEIQRLPDRLRLPFLLCHLEGHGRAEAARQLGLSEGTVWSRLHRARECLQHRLSRRGVSLSAVLGAAAVAVGRAEAAVPAPLADAAVRSAGALMTGEPGVVSARVLELATRGVRAMTVARLKLGLVLTLTAGLLAGGAATLARQALIEGPDVAAGGEAPDDKPGEQAPADRFGDPLPPGARQRLGTVRLRHKAGLRSAGFLPGGGALVTAGEDGWVRFWDPAAGRELRRFGAGLANLALSPDGKVLAGAVGKAVRLWDAATGQELRTLPGGPDYHTAAPLAFSPDGDTLAVVGDGSEVRLYRASTGKELARLQPAAPEVQCLAFADHGQQLVAAGGRFAEYLRVWDVPSGRVAREVSLRGPERERRRPLALSPDGRTLALESAATARVKKENGIEVFTLYRLALWDVETGQQRLRTEGGRDVLWAAAFSPDGTQVATNDMGNRLTVWDAATGQARVQLDGYPGGARPDGLTTLAFSADGRLLAAVGDAAAVHVWDTATGREVGPRAESHQAEVSAVAYSPDGQSLASASGDHTIRLWDPATGRQLQLLRGHQASVRSLVYAPDGRMLASADRHCVLCLWDPATGRARHTIQAVPRTVGVYLGICPLAFTPDGQGLLSWGDDQRLRLWDVATGQEQWNRAVVLKGLPAPGEGRPEKFDPDQKSVRDVRFSPDGRTLAVAVPPIIHLLDVATGHELAELQGHKLPWSLTFSADGRTLASGGWDKEVHLWDAATGQELLRVDRQGFVTALAFAPDVRTVAVASREEEATTVLLDARTGRELLRLRGHDSWTGALAFAPDGRSLAAGLRDTTVLVWDLEPGLRRLESPAGELSPRELEARWADLAGTDARRAREAVWALAAAPAAAVPLLKERVHPVARASPDRIQRLIADLDSPQYMTRQTAQQELATLGVEAEPALRQAFKGSLSAEARRRVEELLAGPAPRGIPAGEVLRRLRAVHVLELAGTPEAERVLTDLAGGAPSARETAEAKAACGRLAGRPRE